MKKLKLLLLAFLISAYCFGQSNTEYPITTTVPFLLIEPNAQSNGIGTIGVVSSKDNIEAGLAQNPALLSKNIKTMGAKVSYLPWHFFNSDIFLFDFGTYYSFNAKNTIAYSFSYFDFGNIKIINSTNTYIVKPFEYSTGIKYAHSFNEHLSLGLGVKYIYSDIEGYVHYVGTPIAHSGKSIAGDIGLDYRNEINISEDKNLRYNFGASVLNVGNKISYTNNDVHKDFIPTILKLGTMWTYSKSFSEKLANNITLAYQAEKLLVPTPPIYDTAGNILKGMSADVSAFKGMTQSFYDAPNGTKEEIHEIAHIIGIENSFNVNNNLILSLRTGMFLEHKLKGNRKINSFGIGINYRNFSVDYCYLRNNNIKMFNRSNISLGYKYNFKKPKEES